MGNCYIDNTILRRMIFIINNLLIKRNKVLIECLKIEVIPIFISFNHKFRILLDYFTEDI